MNINALNFIKNVDKKFGEGKYTFEKMNYTNAHGEVELFCVAGNHYFTTTPFNMTRSAKGCNECQKNTPYSTEEFIEKCKEKHGDVYTYENTVYKNQRTKVTVFCTAHGGDIEVNPATLLNKDTKCGVCAKRIAKSTEMFIKDAVEVHGDKYIYSNVVYKGTHMCVEILCPTHGVFEQSPASHLFGRGCPKCGKYGYRQTEPGYFYIQKLTNSSKTVYKYGITGDMTRRLHEQSRDSLFEHEVLVELYFEDGKKPLELETSIKRTIESGVVSTEELPSGFSETFDEKYLDEVLSIVNNFR